MKKFSNIFRAVNNNFAAQTIKRGKGEAENVGSCEHFDSSEETAKFLAETCNRLTNEKTRKQCFEYC
jgi:hypothetical protein